MNKVIILLGPTGVGKTEVSILLAKALGTEVISGDSMQIYKGMDIGTAKPSEKQREEVKHYMIGIVEPSESYSVGRYIEDVMPVIEALHRKGKIPIVVGGTGLYIKAMTRGIFSGPSADWKLREELTSLEEGQAGALYSYLQELDPEAASKIMPADTRRIIRAIEVCLKTKQGMSELQQKATRPLPYEFMKIGITRNRKELYKMIEGRVDKMIENGLVDEVKKLIAIYRSTHSLSSASRPRRPIHPFTLLGESPEATDSPIRPFTALQAIGYKEISMYLSGEILLEEAIRLIKRNTKRYAKRQFTWFNKEEDIRWTDITGVQDVNEIFKRVWKILNGLMDKAG
ncbi:MAG: tRNA (adenosine(37)-N6)-dimethylallyltransferase MiaA [Thermodesulfovibrionales bacterium]|nr:tRNA (adenosine(37)-N6)-dimethylallyltransferase MiaA [Thermodesulfovibrionales bacterium]